VPSAGAVADFRIDEFEFAPPAAFRCGWGDFLARTIMKSCRTARFSAEGRPAATYPITIWRQPVTLGLKAPINHPTKAADQLLIDGGFGSGA